MAQAGLSEPDWVRRVPVCMTEAQSCMRAPGWVRRVPVCVAAAQSCMQAPGRVRRVAVCAAEAQSWMAEPDREEGSPRCGPAECIRAQAGEEGVHRESLPGQAWE